MPCMIVFIYLTSISELSFDFSLRVYLFRENVFLISVFSINMIKISIFFYWRIWFLNLKRTCGFYIFCLRIIMVLKLGKNYIHVVFKVRPNFLAWKYRNLNHIWLKSYALKTYFFSLCFIMDTWKYVALVILKLLIKMYREMKSWWILKY